MVPSCALGAATRGLSARDEGSRPVMSSRRPPTTSVGGRSRHPARRAKSRSAISLPSVAITGLVMGIGPDDHSEEIVVREGQRLASHNCAAGRVRRQVAAEHHEVASARGDHIRRTTWLVKPADCDHQGRCRTAYRQGVGNEVTCGTNIGAQVSPRGRATSRRDADRGSPAACYHALTVAASSIVSPPRAVADFDPPHERASEPSDRDDRMSRLHAEQLLALERAVKGLGAPVRQGQEEVGRHVTMGALHLDEVEVGLHREFGGPSVLV